MCAPLMRREAAAAASGGGGCSSGGVRFNARGTSDVRSALIVCGSVSLFRVAKSCYE